jgi:2-oxoglutarate ferredoxin oxidoreductase subunit alpha
MIVLAPSSVPETYGLTATAFELAERFRCPVFLLTDKEIAMTLSAVNVDEYPEIGVAERREKDNGLPYAWDPSDAVEPIRQFGKGGAFRFTGSTHDEGAYITKNAEKVAALNQHLIDKIGEHRDEIEMVDADPDPAADTLVISYGVTAGAARAAIIRLRAEAIPTSGLVVQSLWPIPETALAAALEGIDRVVVPELNMGLYRREIERLAGEREVLGVNRVDGTLITVEEIVEAVR